MERKRKLPARAAARVEQASKRRTSTPPADGRTTRSATPAHSAGGGDDSATENSHPPPQPNHLPKSIQAGKPLPTVEQAQPEELPGAEYQSVNESGVLSESLGRSRQKWINEGIFEKYWSKPSKRRGIAVDDPKNPPKDSMVKLGQVIIAVEPHVFEATMYGIKDPKPATALPPSVRPIIMYGPSRGTMPPPSTPTAAVSTPKKLPQSPAQTPAPLPATPNQMVHAHPNPASYQQLQQPQPPSQLPQAPPPMTSAPPRPVPSPRGMEVMLSPGATSPATRPTVPPTSGSMSPSLSNVHQQQQRYQQSPSSQYQAPPPSRPQAPSPSPPASTPKASPTGHPPGTDSIIVTLAERATDDPQLRDLMKRVASGNAPKEDLNRFQAIIDQITLESKRKGSSQGPSADRLIVDGRTVRFFAEEVRTILDIVLRTNPNQTSTDLRPPAGSDPLVVLLVKSALEDARVKDMVRRIGENRPQFSDATDLKAVLDRLKGQVVREKERELQRQKSSLAGPSSMMAAGGPSVAGTNGPTGSGATKAHAISNGLTTQSQQMQQNARGSSSASPAPGTNINHAQSQGTPSRQTPPAQQSLRSKGPPPAPKVDVSAVVFEFSGGTGDRYLFPKFSILEYTTTAQSAREVVASFLIVRKGSASEYGGDPDLDYYQPVTIRLQVAPNSPSSHKSLLDYLARVIAPADEVKRYMDNIMSSMTRAEYVLLAMRLPRKETSSSIAAAAASVGEDGKTEKHSKTDKADKADKMELDSKHEANSNGQNGSYIVGQPQSMQGVLWTATATPSSMSVTPQQKSVKRIVNEDQEYQNSMALLRRKEVDEV